MRGALTLTDQPLMVEAAIDSIGIAFVPKHLTYEYVAQNKIRIILDEYSPSYDGLCLYYPGHRHVSSALKALIDLIRSEFKI